MGFQFNIHVGGVRRKWKFGNLLIAVSQTLDDLIFIDGIGNGLTHPQVIQRRTAGIQSDVTGPGGQIRHLTSHAGKGGCLLIFFISQEGAAVDHVDLASLKCLDAGGGIGNVFDNDLIPIRCISPVVLITDEAGVLAGHIFIIDIGAGAGYAADRLEIPLNQQTGGADRHNIVPAEVIEIGKVRMSVVDYQSGIIHSLHALNIRYRFQRVEAGVRLLVLQICLHRLGVTGRPIMEGHAGAEIKGQGATIIRELPALRQPGNNLAIFIIDQIFIDQHIGTHVRITHVER